MQATLMKSPKANGKRESTSSIKNAFCSQKTTHFIYHTTNLFHQMTRAASNNACLIHLILLLLYISLINLSASMVKSVHFTIDDST